jgi:hypothetical protein
MKSEVVCVNNKNLSVVTFEMQFEKFKEAWSQGMTSLVAACVVFVETIDAIPDGRKLFVEALPEIPHGMWNRFESVGRGHLHPKLFFETGASYGKLIQYPISEQKKAIERGVDVLSADGTTLIIQIKNLTPEQTKQVFDYNHVRSIPEQKAWIESCKSEELSAARRAKRPKPITHRYDAKSKELVVLQPCTFSLREIVKMLREAGAI